MFHNDWEQRKLKEVLDVMDGDRGKNYPSSNDFLDDGHTLFLSASNVTKEGFKFTDNQFITEKKSNSMGNGKLILNDIILTSRGSIGHIALYSNKINKLYSDIRINSGMLILRSHTQNYPLFITQFLKSPIGKKQIDFISFGSAQPQITKKDINNFPIQLPSKEEQIKIGDFFTKLDDTIALQKIDYEIKNRITLSSIILFFGYILDKYLITLSLS
ncbi:restriction endonuclease subunit S [Vagococcus fluvialis]|uniref:restriction endonuclease subunit S n=1 Tax=Vagococcus fluvialis TaxID=2738 RepID=UPI003B20B85A